MALFNKWIVIVMVGAFLAGCQMLQRNSASASIVPDPVFMRGLPQGQDSFSQGFRDGCYQFIGNSGYGMQRLYDYPIATDAIDDELYKQGYNHGDRYCSVYVMKATIL